MKAYVLANFGGPRKMEEIPSFLRALLTDRDVIRTNLPNLFHRFLFSRVAKKRAKKIAFEYEEMGGKSPIYEDTEALAELLRPNLDGPLLTFHRYIDETHPKFIEEMSRLDVDEIRVLPLFPQFTYATTGSIARFFEEHLPWKISTRLRWVRSYAREPAFIDPFVDQIQRCLKENQLDPKDVFFLFSAHGVPASYIASGDVYLEECRSSMDAVMKAFPGTPSLLAFQSQFGSEEWLRPYTKDISENIHDWIQKKEVLFFIPITFTSDHIETLQEIGKGYLPMVKRQGIKAFLVPALGIHPQWVKGCLDLLNDISLSNNQMLIRKRGCKTKCDTCRKVCRK